MTRRTRQGLLLIILVLAFGGCAGRPHGDAAVRSEPGAAGKAVSFAILADYDRGDDLEKVAQDFRLMRELGFSELRCSFGWDDYEPRPGEYDFAWLKAFCRLALAHGIALRPYLGYTPGWAGMRGTDDQEWNKPPGDLALWSAFVFRLASELREFPNILSYEIYNEENARFWWDGSVERYRETLQAAVAAVRAAGVTVPVLMGGLVNPDADWLAAIAGPRQADGFDVVAFHAYPETWSVPPGVTVETYLDERYRTRFVPLAGGRPIWINEMGYATAPGRTEAQQANWFARAVSTFLQEPSVTHLGLYELRDSPAERAVLGESENYYLGLVRSDGRRKIAFDTVRLLMNLLNVGALAPLDAQASSPEAYSRAFRRPDGSQVAFIYSLTRTLTVELRLPLRGRAAVAYDLHGADRPWPEFDGLVLSNIRLEPGEVRIFRIDP